MITVEITGYGVAAAIAEIRRTQFDLAEARLREKMKPARLAASDAVIEEFGGSQLSTTDSQPLR
jgi:hypothetical protein